jgi:hypothetical protein
MKNMKVMKIIHESADERNNVRAHPLTRFSSLCSVAFPQSRDKTVLAFFLLVVVKNGDRMISYTPLYCVLV